VDLKCTRVNLFIGKPNSGKSNLLEALGIVSWVDEGGKFELKKVVRMLTPQHLFRNEETTQTISIIFWIKDKRYTVTIKTDQDRIRFYLDRSDGKPLEISTIDFNLNESDKKDRTIIRDNFFGIKNYYYNKLLNFYESNNNYLLPPDGRNLFTLITSRKEYKERMRSFFKPYGIEVVFKPQTKSFEVQTRVGDDIFSHPYYSVSDTFQRMIFYLMAIESNENSTLVFEEPEIHSFPSYVKMLAQIIAEDKRNQYFISTHNPYLFETLLEKTEKKDITVNVVSYEDNKTKITQIPEGELSGLLDTDPFFNLDRLAQG
jgi:AAA15 family ATPase/GTPase